LFVGDLKKKNVKILENEACLRGEECIAPPKTCNTGKLPELLCVDTAKCNVHGNTLQHAATDCNTL